MAFRRSLILEALAEKEPSEPEAEPGAEILPQTGVFFFYRTMGKDDDLMVIEWVFPMKI